MERKLVPNHSENHQNACSSFLDVRICCYSLSFGMKFHFNWFSMTTTSRFISHEIWLVLSLQCPPVPQRLVFFIRMPQASQLGVYKAFVDNYKVALETAEKCSHANSQFQKISEVSSSTKYDLKYQGAAYTQGERLIIRSIHSKQAFYVNFFFMSIFISHHSNERFWI